MCGAGPAPGRTVSPVGGERGKNKQAGEALGRTSGTSSVRLTPSGSVIRTKEFSKEKNEEEKKKNDDLLK